MRARERAAHRSAACGSARRVTVDPENGSSRFSFGADARADGHRRDARAAARAARRARRRAKPAGRAGPRRVPGDRRHRPRAAEADARGLPAAAGGGPRLPGQQAPHDASACSTTQRAVLAQRQADGARADPARAVRGLHPRALRAHRPPDRRRGRRRACSTITGGHPYATQELCYFLWEETPSRRARRRTSTRRSPPCCARSTRTSACSGSAPRRRSGSCCRRSPGSPGSR